MHYGEDCMTELKKAHITAFIPELSGGGAQGVFVTVMNYYVHIGYSVKVVVGTLENDIHSHEFDNSIIVEELNVASSKESLSKLVRYVRDNEVHLAFVLWPEWAVNLVIARMILRKNFTIIGRCINTLSYEYKNAEGAFRRVITYKLVKMFYHKVDCVVAQSENMKGDLVKNFGFKAEQIYTINNPLSDVYERELDAKPESDRDNYLLFVGRFEKQKGIDKLLEAFSNISDKNIKLFLFGKGSQEENLKLQAKRLGISERVLFFPFDKKIIRYYRKAKLTVMSSIFEGFPNVLAESIACGTPVVSFDLPSGPREIIVEGVNGYLAQYLNEDDLAKKIDAAISAKWNYKEIKSSAQRFSKKKILPKYKLLMEMWSSI